ncbi:unnamed protein product, partial [Rangifer tarandus platyrhynchus]
TAAVVGFLSLSSVLSLRGNSDKRGGEGHDLEPAKRRPFTCRGGRVLSSGNGGHASPPGVRDVYC